MVNIEELKKVIDDSGMTVTAIAEKAGMTRATLYNRMAGNGEFTVAEAAGLALALHMTKAQRDAIFFAGNVA